MTSKAITKAVAEIEPGADDAQSENGTFRVILSTPTADRDGEEVKSTEWELPLPDHITFDMDHGMSVATTVGSGTPSLGPDGKLYVDGTYSSRPIAQEVRSLVSEKHIRTTSVAFLRKYTTDQKSGARTMKRELLNGAFVAVPANKEAVVVEGKGFATLTEDEAAVGVKLGARNNSNDQDALDKAHDAVVVARQYLEAVGAKGTIDDGDDTGDGGAGEGDGRSSDDASGRQRKALARARELGLKYYFGGAGPVSGSYEADQSDVSDALRSLYPSDPDGDDDYDQSVSLVATYSDAVVYQVSSYDPATKPNAGIWRAPWSRDAQGNVTIGQPSAAKLTVSASASVVSDSADGKSYDPGQRDTTPGAAPAGAASAPEGAAGLDLDAARKDALQAILDSYSTTT